LGDGKKAMQMKRREPNNRRGEGENDGRECWFRGSAAEVCLRTPFFWDRTLLQ